MSSNSKISILLVLCLTLLSAGILSCGGGEAQVSGQASVENAGTDISACLSQDSLDLASIFAGPCSAHPGDENPDPAGSISYADILSIALKEMGEAGEQVVDCVAKEAYCTGETQCLTLTSICQFALNCGADNTPCAGDLGTCHATKVVECQALGTKSECNASYSDYCFDGSGARVNCDGSGGAVSQSDSHNCYWGVDHNTNQTGCYSYGSEYGESTCTVQ